MIEIGTLRDYFDRVVVISLKRRQDRLAAFFRQTHGTAWPFKAPDVFEAVDGLKLPQPYAWTEGGGTWGCMQSHRQVLERALMDGVGSLLVLEDDVVLRPSFVADAGTFLAGVPADWEGLMFGGQMFDSHPIAPGIVRCLNCQRTHAYAVRGEYMRALYQHLISTTGHCDHRMGEIQGRYRIYAPDPFLAGQREGLSDISCSVNPAKFWTPPRAGAPVVCLKAPKAVLPALRTYGFHTGFNRDPDSDIDVGLRDAFAKPEEEWVGALREWIDMIQWEVASMDRAVCTVWHPRATFDLLRAATAAPIIPVAADTVEDALRQCPRDNPAADAVARRDVVVLLRTPRDVVERLRESGFHTGFWRDSESDVDNGLLEIFRQPAGQGRIDRMKAWVAEVGREAENMNAVVAVWHPDATAGLLAAAAARPVVEIIATDLHSAMEQWAAAVARIGHDQPLPRPVGSLVA